MVLEEIGMRKSTLWALLAGLCLFGMTTVASAQDIPTATVTVQNNSSFAIFHWMMSPVSQNLWGPDQLGTAVVSTGGTFQLVDVPCDLYDVKLIDEDGDECVLGGVAVCDDDFIMEITDENLIGCQVATQEAAEGTEPAEVPAPEEETTEEAPEAQ
jgi:hypothetical protein